MLSFRSVAGPVAPDNLHSAPFGGLGGGRLGMIWVTNCCELFSGVEDGAEPSLAGPVSCYYQSPLQVPIKEGETYRLWAIVSQ